MSLSPEALRPLEDGKSCQDRLIRGSCKEMTTLQENFAENATEACPTAISSKSLTLTSPLSAITQSHGLNRAADIVSPQEDKMTIVPGYEVTADGGKNHGEYPVMQ